MFRYKIKVGQDEGNQHHVYFVDSAREIRPELLQIAGLILDDGISPEDECELLPLSQAYVSVRKKNDGDEFYASEEWNTPGDEERNGCKDAQ